MKKWIMSVTLVWCLLLISYQHTASQSVLVWTEKGCDASYKPGETVKVHYRVDGGGWTRVFKQYPDTHEEEISGWRYFPTGAEYVEIDTLGPECGTITYTVVFYQEVCVGCIPCCNAITPSVVPVMETGKNMCSINVLCDMKASLFTDKTEYMSGVDSEAKITLSITDVYGNLLDADSVVMDVNGESITAIKTSAGLYTASFTLSAKQGEYTVTAAIYKRDYPQLVRTATFTVVVPVIVHLSTEKEVYTQNAQVTIRAEVKDTSGRGVSGLHFDLSIAQSDILFTDLGGGIYEAQVDLSGFEQGHYTADITSMGEHVQVESVRKAEFMVSGLPNIVVTPPEPLEVRTGSTKDQSLVLKNAGDGDAVGITVSVEAPPGVDVMGVTGYGSVIPPGDETTVFISVQGRETGVYTVTATVSYQDVSGGTAAVSESFHVTVTSGIGLFLIAGAAIAGVLGAGAYILKGRGTKAAEEASEKPGEKGASAASQDTEEKVVLLTGEGSNPAGKLEK